jgi:hypothetical protein
VTANQIIPSQVGADDSIVWTVMAERTILAPSHQQ